MSSEIRVVLVTAPREAAHALAGSLVASRAAACVNVLPGVTSVYRWEGEVREDPEALLVIKTTADGVAGLREAVAREHPYDVPEFLSLVVDEGLPDYLSWVAASTGGRD